VLQFLSQSWQFPLGVHVVAVDAEAGVVSLEGSISLAKEAVEGSWSIASEAGVGALLANAISIHVVSGWAVALASSRVHCDRVVLARCAGVGVVSNTASFAAQVTRRVGSPLGTQ
jgi:glycine/D-amino acid oxidase-like deaminating enzyme